ncbi:T9SS type A sorting domain-containing protein [Dokdonia ponticola]|uniref:T9SS type A sorting domain-containing protein n=1 Tax=Dokdonia ponticola TaxID=2041041 RepID=A0ABV9HWZ9_9FLAO
MMKQFTLGIALLLVFFTMSAQDITLSFENPEITTDGMDSFYEVDVMISSDVAFSLGSGQFFLDYNPAAFGIQVANNGAIEFERPTTSLLGGQTIVDVGGTPVPLGANYTSFISNDTTDDKVSFIWQQNASGGMYGDNVPTATPVELVHLKIRFLPGATAEDPSVCFDATNPFDDQFFTACGPYDPLVGFSFETADCFNEPGSQILDYTPDCSGAVIFNGVNFVWENDAWTPQDPEGVSTQADNIEVLSPDAILVGDVVANNVTVASGGTLDIAANTLSLHGNLDVAGTLTADQSTIAISGAAAQAIGGDFSVLNLVVNNTGTADASLTGTVDVLGTVTLTDGVLNVSGGTLTFKSNASTTAMLDEVADGTITGDVTVERYMSSRRAFRLTTSAVTTTSTINANWQEGVNNVDGTNQDPNPGFGTHITGGDAGANGFDDTETDNASMFVLNNVGQAWEALTNTDTDVLTAGKGYRLFIRGSRSIDLTSNTPAPSETILRATGNLAIGDVSQTDFSPVAGDFNFFGNPYQASVDMGAVTTASTNVNTNQYFMWDPSLGERGAYVTVLLPSGTNTSMSAANQFLQPGQAGFVTTATAGAASILFTETSKAVGENTATSFTEDNPLEEAHIIGQLYRTDAYTNGASLQDSFGIFFSPDHSNSITLEDAPKFFNQDESMAIANGDHILSIERRFLPEEGEVIPLVNTTYRAEAYTLVVNVASLGEVTAYLVDAFTGVSTALTEGENVISFTVNSGDESSASDRFSFAFAEAALATEDTEAFTLTMFPNPIGDSNLNTVSTDLQGKAVNLTVTNMLGQQVYRKELQFAGNTLTTTAMSTVGKGIYFVTLTSDKGTVTRRIIKQ